MNPLLDRLYRNPFERPVQPLAGLPPPARQRHRLLLIGASRHQPLSFAGRALIVPVSRWSPRPTSASAPCSVSAIAVRRFS